MIRVLIMLLFFIIHSSVIFSENFSHSFQVSLNLAKSYYSNGAQVAIPIEGTRNVRLEIVDVVLDQPIWSQKSDQYISKGEISVIVKDEKINWHEMFKSRELVFRVEILDDLVDIPFRSLPYAIFSDHASRARQFTNTDFVNIDYKNKKIIINNVTANGQLVVSGSVLATELIGDGSQLKNLTGPGFSTGYSLNSENSQYKDVLFVSNSGNVGINVTTPSARLHIRGNAAFQPLKSNIEEFYTVPTGSILLWDPARSAFRSGVFTRVFSSNDIGKYSVAFGEDVISKALYSSIIAGEDHLISNIAVSSVIIGGQSHKIMDTNSVIVGGFDNLINGEWSVIFGGSNHNIHGPYNVLLGGKENKIVGELNTSIGRLNELVGDYVTVIGNMNKVSANTSVALGQSVSIRHENSFVYSDGYQPAKSQQDHQFIVMPRNGLGINMAPMDNVMLNVSGNIKAIRLKGDGQYLRNIISGQDYWKQRIEGGQRVGIYYMDGPVSVGTKLNYANLTVSGGITIQDSAQASNVANGTIRFTSENGLQLFHNQWVSLDQVDTNTLLTNGRGISLVNQTFGLDQMGAALKNAFIFNGSIWAPTDPLFWINYDKGILLDSKLELITTDKQVNAPLIIESNASGTKTKHPFVFGGANSLIFSPLNSEVFFNLDYTDDTHSKYKLFNSSDDSVGLSSFGASIRVKNDRLSISQTDKAYHSDEVVNMQSRLNLSPTSAFTTVKPRATLDINGSVGFLNTFFNQNLENGTKGIGHFNLYNNDYSHYLFFDSNQNLNLNSGTDSLTQPINFNISGSKKAYFDINGNFIIGTENARARLSIFGGGVAMNVNGSQVMSSYRSGHHTSIRSRSNSDPSIELFNNSTLLSTFGSRSFAIGATNNANVLLLSSAQYPTIDIISKSKSELMLSNLNSHYNIKNDNGIFSISQIKSNKSNPIIHLD
ncbi:MAG: hypothetical protein VW397_05100, partial [Candidatus Margulisiibacteriota bacterium]